MIDVEEVQKRLWAYLLQHYNVGLPLDYAIQELRCLMGDAALWVHNNMKELDLELVKKEITSIQMNMEASPDFTVPNKG